MMIELGTKKNDVFKYATDNANFVNIPRNLQEKIVLQKANSEARIVRTLTG